MNTMVVILAENNDDNRGKPTSQGQQVSTSTVGSQVDHEDYLVTGD